ncbi:glycosyltransferase family 4 protein [Kordiimonas pumila]|uniref:Glycosyltransferase family 4 protein n=1 Tax=Kordiimonas pumila TaxID=2161677 RepID=A0ABV7D0U6_9PROT|nr:glycosyltransferase family 1 protein [Kordiimonas pumila]
MSIKVSNLHDTPAEGSDTERAATLNAAQTMEPTMPFETYPFQPKRIALFSGNYNYVMDGPVRALNKLVGFLEKQNIEVLVFAPTAKEPAFKHNGTLISVPSVPIPGRSEYRMALGLPRKHRRMLEEFAPDLIHLAAPDILGCAALRWARKNNVPAVASFHTRFDTYPRYYHLGWIEKYVTAFMRRFYHKCTHIYAPSSCMVQVLKAQDMAPDIRIWSRGVELDTFNPSKRNQAWRRAHGIEDHDILIAFVGRVVLEKGLGVFADTLDKLTAMGIAHKALIVGDGPERQRFSERLPNAVFTGYLRGDELATAYASSDIFFNASITETFGNVTLEAMASGLPCICADATGSRSLVEHGKNGYLVEPSDISGFALRIAELINNPALRTEMASASLQKGRGFSWESILAGLLEQYRDVLASEALKGHPILTMRYASDLHTAE